jgi:hypothetical protein
MTRRGKIEKPAGKNQPGKGEPGKARHGKGGLSFAAGWPRLKMIDPGKN